MVCRYVDDYFACVQEGCVKHAMDCFAELVRLMLGSTAVSDKKLGFGNPLCILGLVVQISPDGLKCAPSGDKVKKWLRIIRHALAVGRLTPGDASKLAGRLSWATQSMFHRCSWLGYFHLCTCLRACFGRFGRAMLRPLFRQQYGRSGKIRRELALALEWWIEVLSAGISETKMWRSPDVQPVRMYADARSTPPRVAAVVIHDGR